MKLQTHSERTTASKLGIYLASSLMNNRERLYLLDLAARVISELQTTSLILGNIFDYHAKPLEPLSQFSYEVVRLLSFQDIDLGMEQDFPYIVLALSVPIIILVGLVILYIIDRTSKTLMICWNVIMTLYYLVLFVPMFAFSLSFIDYKFQNEQASPTAVIFTFLFLVVSIMLGLFSASFSFQPLRNSDPVGVRTPRAEISAFIYKILTIIIRTFLIGKVSSWIRLILSFLSILDRVRCHLNLPFYKSSIEKLFLWFLNFQIISFILAAIGNIFEVDVSVLAYMFVILLPVGFKSTDMYLKHKIKQYSFMPVEDIRTPDQLHMKMFALLPHGIRLKTSKH